MSEPSAIQFLTFVIAGVLYFSDYGGVMKNISAYGKKGVLTKAEY